MDISKNVKLDAYVHQDSFFNAFIFLAFFPSFSPFFPFLFFPFILLCFLTKTGISSEKVIWGGGVGQRMAIFLFLFLVQFLVL